MGIAHKFQQIKNIKESCSLGQRVNPFNFFSHESSDHFGQVRAFSLPFVLLSIPITLSKISLSLFFGVHSPCMFL